VICYRRPFLYDAGPSISLITNFALFTLLRPQPTQANYLETSWKPGSRTSCELVSN